MTPINTMAILNWINVFWQNKIPIEMLMAQRNLTQKFILLSLFLWLYSKIYIDTIYWRYS